jgi:hypothetical protein
MHTKFLSVKLKESDHSDDNIGMDLREIGWEGMDWMVLAQDRDERWALVHMVTNLRVP